MVETSQNSCPRLGAADKSAKGHQGALQDEEMSYFLIWVMVTTHVHI